MTYQYVKANLILNSKWIYVLIIGTVLAANTTKLPPIFMLLIITLAFIITQFYFDQRSNINRFFISLPVSKKGIVQGRYFSIVMIIMLYVLVQWALGFTGMEMHYAFHWKDVLAVICLSFIMAAIVIPFFYLIPSFIVAVGTIIIFMLFGMFIFLDALVSILGLDDVIIFNDLDPGLILLVEKHIPYQPYLLFILASVVLLYLSVKISEYIFQCRNH